MGEDKKSFRDELEKFASISDIVENSILSKGNVKILVELESEDYRYVLSNFADVYRNIEEIVINISGVNFTFVLKK